MEKSVASLLKALSDFEDIYFQLREGFVMSSDEDVRENKERHWAEKDDESEYLDDESGGDEESENGMYGDLNLKSDFDGYDDDISSNELIYSPISDDWVSENDYQLDCENTLNNFLNLLLELSFSLKHGDIKSFKSKLSESKDLLSNDFLSDQLYKTIGKDSDDVTSILFSITENIDFGEYFENEIIALPNNIIELTEEIMYQISNNPELMHSLESRLFEELIKRILIKFKIKSSLTKRTRDGGFDIIGVEDAAFSKNNYIIECKRYAPQKKVSVDVVQRLYGVKQSAKVTKAFLVTSSSFTKPAIEWAKQHCWELELKDYNDIAGWLKMFWHR
jgi:HJR/Mrr/RecB family endonuclease